MCSKWAPASTRTFQLLSGVSVHTDFRRQGVARLLVAEIERKLADQGAKRTTALVEKDHPWATSFWEAVEYRVDGRVVRRVHNL